MINLKNLMKGKIKNINSGITLIALVITVIVMLILAGISITMITGDNSILQKAGDAKKSNDYESAKEQVELTVLGSIDTNGTINKDRFKKEIEDLGGTATGEDFPIIATLNDFSFSIDNKGNVEKPITEYVKVGDYINYDPIYSDASKTKKVDSSKLTYTSPTGTATQHGNGYTSSETLGGQKFTAKSTQESGIKWRVLTVTDEKIEIISDRVIKKDAINQNNGGLLLKGVRGYLYAEQELNEVCKIYGYGYGADTSVGSSFKVGGPYPGEEKTITIEGTGARSIKVEDINKIAGIYEDQTDGKMKYSDGTLLSTTYGITTYPISNIKYPTMNTSRGNSTTGISNSVGVKNLKCTIYEYNKSIITDTTIQNILFNDNYWLASRCVFYNTNVSVEYFNGFVVKGERLSWNNEFCYGNTSYIYEFNDKAYAVRPIITLKVNSIDTSNANENSGKDAYTWNLK